MASPSPSEPLAAPAACLARSLAPLRLGCLRAGDTAHYPACSSLPACAPRVSDARAAAAAAACFVPSPACSLDALRPTLPLLKRLVMQPDKEVLADACWAFSYLSDGDDARIQAVVDTQVAPELIKCLQHASAR